MKKIFASLMLAIAAIGLSGCGPEAPRPPTAEEQRATALANSAANSKLQDLLEQQRSTAVNNAQSNAQSYFALNPRFDSSYKIIPHTDDYISPACPQGSGFAWLSIMKVVEKQVEKKIVWCSTSSASVGCFIEEDFKKSPYAAQASKCNADLPHPLKPIGK